MRALASSYIWPWPPSAFRTLIDETNGVVNLSARAAAFAPLDLARFDGSPDLAYLVEAMDELWESVNGRSFGYSRADFAEIERDFVLLAERQIVKIWAVAGVDIDLDHPDITTGV